MQAMYNVNLTTIIDWLLPSFLKGPTIVAFLRAAVLPLQNLHFSLDAFRTQKHYELSITSQVIWLEKMLNKLYDPINEDIYIVDVGASNQVNIYFDSEVKRPPILFFASETATEETVIYFNSESVNEFNFTVMVPAALYSTLVVNNNSLLSNMKININKYKIFGTVYIIKSY